MTVSVPLSASRSSATDAESPPSAAKARAGTASIASRKSAFMAAAFKVLVICTSSRTDFVCLRASDAGGSSFDKERNQITTSNRSPKDCDERPFVQAVATQRLAAELARLTGGDTDTATRP